MAGDFLVGQMYLAPHLAEAATNDPVVGQLRGVHDFTRKGYDAIRGALRTQDPTRTAEAHFMEISKKAERWLDDCARKAEGARTGAATAIASVEREIAETLGIKEGTYAQEIRSHFSQLAKNDRVAAITAAIDAFDKETLGALLSAPAYLSGLSADEQATFKRLYAEKHAPDAIKRKAILEEAVAINSRAFDEAIVEVGTMFPKSKIADISARIEKAQAAKNEILAS